MSLYRKWAWIIREFPEGSDALAMMAEYEAALTSASERVSSLESDLKLSLKYFRDEESENLRLRGALEKVSIWDGVGNNWSQEDLTRILRERGQMARHALHDARQESHKTEDVTQASDTTAVSHARCKHNVSGTDCFECYPTKPDVTVQDKLPEEVFNKVKAELDAMPMFDRESTQVAADWKRALELADFIVMKFKGFADEKYLGQTDMWMERFRGARAVLECLEGNNEQAAQDYTCMDCARRDQECPHEVPSMPERPVHGYRFTLNGKGYVSQKPIMSWAEIMATDGHDATYQLFQEGSDTDKLLTVRDYEVQVEGQKFYTAPPCTFASETTVQGDNE